MYTKKAIVTELTKLVQKTLKGKVAITDLVVGGSGTFVMLGYRTHARDIDTFVSTETFEKILDITGLEAENTRGLIKDSRSVDIGDVEVWENYPIENPVTQITDGVKHFTLEDERRFRLKLGRPKDQVAIDEIDAILKKQAKKTKHRKW